MSILDTINKAEKELTGQQSSNDFSLNGFTVPPGYDADGNGLPTSKINYQRTGKIKRNIMSWFIPEFGILRMYVNPNSITINNSKAIQPDRTKGGYSLLYWGEELIPITLQGTTGSAGIEGINILYEMYRAEQYAFDGLGLNIAATNSAAYDSLTNGIGSLFGDSSSLVDSIFGIGSNSDTLMPKNIPSMAQYAFTVEMYYGGEVYRGYFKSMNVTETTDLLISYNITFMATQRRGYRSNYLPWHKSPNNGPSSYDDYGAYPYSYKGAAKQ